MNLVKSIAAMAVALGLSACEAPVSFKAQPGQSAQSILDSIALTRGIAVGISRVCRSFGITLIEPDYRMAIRRDIENLKAQGYDVGALRQAEQNLNTKELITEAVTYLEERGARKGNAASACAVGAAEIKAGTPVGRLLKKV